MTLSRLSQHIFLTFRRTPWSFPLRVVYVESGSHPKIAPAPVLAGSLNTAISGEPAVPPVAKPRATRELACPEQVPLSSCAFAASTKPRWVLRHLCPWSTRTWCCPHTLVWVTDTGQTDSLGLSTADVPSPEVLPLAWQPCL